MSEIKLKPCPRCKERPLLAYTRGKYYIISTDKITGMCLCSSITKAFRTSKAAKREWSRRADS